MTNLTKNLMLAMAACTIAAGTAAAQTYTAQIPFTFRAGKTVMAPGTYQIRLGGLTSTRSVSLYSQDLRKGAILVPTGTTGEHKDLGAFKVRFACAGKDCALASIWVGGWEGAYMFPKAKLGSAETARVVEVDVTRVKAD